MTRLSVVGVTVLAAIVAGLFVATNVALLDLAELGPGVPYVRLYDPPEHRLEVIVNQGDGQAFAALAQDPLLERPEVFRAGTPEAAYRAQRPLLGWLTWALSAGQAGAVPLVLVLLSITGFTALGFVLAQLLSERGAAPAWAVAVLVTPGALVTLDWTGPECLGAAVALAGAGWWATGNKRWGLVALVLAGLLRESLLLVPLALIGHGLLLDRRSWRSLLPLATPFVLYGAWVGVVWLRLDALPSDAGRGRLGLPFLGLVDAAGGWDPSDAAFAALILGVGTATAWLARRDPMGWIAGAFVLASLCFGPDVWARVDDFSRILLPVAGCALVELVPRRSTTTAPASNISS